LERKAGEKQTRMEAGREGAGRRQGDLRGGGRAREEQR